MSIQLNGETRLHIIIGDPIGQVKSPENLTRIINERGVNAMVVPVHVTSEDLPAFMASVRLMRNLDGIVVTVPHKFAALGYCDITTDRAAFVGSANVLWRLPDGRWKGDNVDGVGHLDGVLKEGFDVAGKRALLIGAGGAGSAIAFEILERGAAALAVHDMDKARLDRLVGKLSERFPGKVSVGSGNPEGFDLVTNATPAGMRPEDPLPVDAGRLKPDQFVSDVITKPEISPLLEAARKTGCRTMPGSGMFHAQAELLVDLLLGAGREKS